MSSTTRTTWRQFHDQQAPLTRQDLLESNELMSDIRKLVKAGVNAGIEALANKLASFASERMVRLDRSTKEYGILSKIQQNPKGVATQLMGKAIAEIPTVDLST